MKRAEALVELSRDHHHGLVVAQRLNRSTKETALAAREAFLVFWESEGHAHFRIEEALLLPAAARHHPADHEAIVRVLVDHVDIRRRAAALAADPAPSTGELQALGQRLAAHIRHEERTLFPLIEATMPQDELAALATAIADAHEPSGGG